MQKPTFSYFDKYLSFIKKNGLYPDIRKVTGTSFTPNVSINGKNFLSFTSNNYLGLAGDEGVKNLVKESVDKYGVGSGSTRLLSGTLDVQVEFENILANFLGFDETITFSSGYLANIGVIRMLVDPFPYFRLFAEGEGVIISDELNHASIIDGVRLAKSPRERYRHSNMSDLENLLKNSGRKRKLILTDGVFSMDGDVAKLPEIASLAEKYDAILMVDDSHGLGVLGPHGEGSAHHLGVEKKVDVLMGSFTKAFGNIGGFVAVSKNLEEYLRITARSYIFSDPIPPAFVSGLIKQLQIIKNGDELRKVALKNANALRSGLSSLGFSVLGEATTIVPLLIGNEKEAIKFSEELVSKNILAPCIRRPAVEEGKERIRFSVTALHTSKDIEQLLSVCAEIGKAVGLI